MKVLHSILALALVFTLSCKDQKAAHSHEGEHGHSHAEDGSHTEANEQEQFTLTEKDGENEATPTYDLREDTVEVLVPAQSALEYKFEIEKGGSLGYEWSATATLIYDFHGDPDPSLGFEKGYYRTYSKGKAQSDAGTEEMPYLGSHGWYWKNESDQDITISLQTKGRYKVLGLK
ncbi:hypothetical protein [Sediminicola luteus]|uniref:Uncharacterized protein n=1 Tax=Sediminicola luteus TaxID=319238 RepID=A0A2A4G3N4_9FLAO|nr:hypothetical protein [Sediminicola luteus]PCE63041.1 hypothetical protein B7P33_17360 [Sediminicola luteus]